MAVVIAGTKRTVYPGPSPPTQPDFSEYSSRALQTHIHISWKGMGNMSEDYVISSAEETYFQWLHI